MDRHRLWHRTPSQVPEAGSPIHYRLYRRQERSSERSNDASPSSTRLSTTSTVTDDKIRASTTSSQASTTPITTTSKPSFTSIPISQRIGADVIPEVTRSTFATSTTAQAAVIIEFPTSPPAMPDTLGPPQMVFPHHQKPLMTPGAEAAAIALSILGALSLIIAATVYFRQRKHEPIIQFNEPRFNNIPHLRAPETAYIESNTKPGHLTRSSSHTTLFSAATYTRPETVSTNRSLSTSRFPAHRLAPNPFADPPRKKAYDVLAGRPRSTTLTDRGSWIENPFKDPASERFDPFGELQQKARKERIRYMEQIRREAEAQKEDGIEPRWGHGRKGSGVTIEGIGILDRSNKDVYR